MFPAFLLGVLLLVGLVLLAKWFVTTEPRQVLRAVYWTAGSLIVVAGLFLALTGRLGWAAAALGAALPWGARILRMAGLLQGLRGLFGGVGTFGAGDGGGRATGRSSEVASAYLRMKLDHDTGGMTGVVLAGPLAGRSLESLNDPEIKSLISFVSEDADSRALLDSWLDRERPGWREGAGRGEGAEGAGHPGSMTRAEALAILDLTDPVDAETVKAAYRRLMRQAHPDHGGSAWLASKVNQARDVLLKE